MKTEKLITYYIYEITNNLNGKTYIGQRQCPIRKTPETDVNYMGKGTAIQAAERKYGIDYFSKKILAVCYSTKIIDVLEREYIHLYKEIGKAEYNIAGGGQTRCREFMSEEQKVLVNQKIGLGVRNSEKHKLATQSEEFRKKMSETHKGKSSSLKGVKHGSEHRKHISESLQQLYNSSNGDVVRDKLRQVNLGKTISQETRIKISQANKGRIVNSKTREKLRQTNLGKIVSEETKQKIRDKRALQAPRTKEQEEQRLKNLASFWNSPEGLAKKKELSDKGKQHKHPEGLHWYNDGIKSIKAKECPEGFVPGRLGNFSQSKEANQKRSDWYNNLTDEQRKEYKQRISNSHKGKHFTAERKKHIGDGNRGRKYYNNGIIEVMQFECPEGFVPGRCPKSKQAISKGIKKN